MLPLSLTMQQEDEEDERADQIEAGIKDKAIPAGDHDEPMRMDEGKASILEDGATRGYEEGRNFMQQYDNDRGRPRGGINGRVGCNQSVGDREGEEKEH